MLLVAGIKLLLTRLAFKFPTLALPDTDTFVKVPRPVILGWLLTVTLPA